MQKNKKYQNYSVFSDGRIYSYYSNKFLKQKINRFGYAELTLIINSKKKSIKVHRLVAELFIKNTKLKPQVNHKDGNKLNNSVSNLEWVTSKENQQHASKLGLTAKGERNGNSKLSKNKTKMIKCLFDNGFSFRSIASVFGVTHKTVSEICNNKTWK